MRIRTRLAMASLALVVLWRATVWAVGQSAIITLVFPPGARATGLGEAFVALSDDINATFFNPAGLGQAPLANAWKAYRAGTNEVFTGIAARPGTVLGVREKIWAGTARGILKYNGKTWEAHEIHLIEKEKYPDLETMVGRLLPAADEKTLARSLRIIREYNGIGLARREAVGELLSPCIESSRLTIAPDSLPLLIDDILRLEESGRREAQVYAILSERADSSLADSLAERIPEILTMDDIAYDDLLEIKIPFSIAVSDSVTAMVVDSSDRLWVGTPAGVWYLDELTWHRISMVDGLPSDNVSGIAVSPSGDVAVATDAGLGLRRDGTWARYTREDGLVSDTVLAVAFGPSGAVYAGTPAGLMRGNDTAWTVLDTGDGLLSTRVTALLIDSRDNLWVGGPEGVSLYTGARWKRYRFPASGVHDIAESRNGQVWIGTDKGAIHYTPGKTTVNSAGERLDAQPVWKGFHSKNALKGDRVYGVAIHGEDVWLATDRAINQYDRAENQAFLFVEQLLPEFNLPDLWHAYGAISMPTDEWGTLGFAINFINFGEIELYDELGRKIKSVRAWESAFGLCYGMPLSETFSLGLNVKYFISALLPGYGPNNEGVAMSWAIDAAVLKRNFLAKNLSCGLTLQNMGPAVFYIDEEDKDPIPFNVKFGFAYRALQTAIHELTLLADINREIVKPYLEKSPDPFWKAIYTDLDDSPWRTELSEVNLNLGAEYWYVGFLALRTGFLYDYIGERYELTLGMGIKYGNLNFDWSFIHSPEKSFKFIAKDKKQGSHGARHGQARYSLIFRF